MCAFELMEEVKSTFLHVHYSFKKARLDNFIRPSGSHKSILTPPHFGSCSMIMGIYEDFFLLASVNVGSDILNYVYLKKY